MVEQGKPLIWFVNEQIGQPSTVWMYRQLIGLSDWNCHFIGREQLNEIDYPLHGIATHLIPRNALKRSLWRRVASLFHQHTGGEKFYFANQGYEFQWLKNKLLNKTKPDLVFCQYGRNAIRYSEFFSKLQIPVVVQFNGYDLSRALKNAFYARSLRRALKFTAGCVVVADYMESELHELGVHMNKIVFIPYGAPTAEFSPRKRDFDGTCNFLAVGNFVEKKRPDLTIRAAVSCIQTTPDSRLTMIGDGPLMGECESLKNRSGLDDRIEFLGTKSNADVRQFMSKANVFLQHSVTDSQGDKEGWPVAVGEAAASGLPIVSTKHASIPLQVLHGRTGYLVDEGDWESMSHFMRLLALDPKLRTEFSQAARELSLQTSTEKQIIKLKSFFAKIMKI